MGQCGHSRLYKFAPKLWDRDGLPFLHPKSNDWHTTTNKSILDRSAYCLKSRFSEYHHKVKLARLHYIGRPNYTSQTQPSRHPRLMASQIVASTHTCANLSYIYHLSYVYVPSYRPPTRMPDQLPNQCPVLKREPVPVQSNPIRRHHRRHSTNCPHRSTRRRRCRPRTSLPQFPEVSPAHTVAHTSSRSPCTAPHPLS